MTVEADGRDVALTSLDRVLYPETGFTKGDLVAYYHAIARVGPAPRRAAADARPLARRRRGTGLRADGVPWRACLAGAATSAAA